MTSAIMSQLEAGNVNPISFRFARYGFNLLAIYWILRLFLNPDGFNVENIAVSLLLAASVTSLMLQVYLGNRRNQTYSQLDFVSRAALYALLLVCAITWLRGITTNPKQIITLLFNPIVGGTVWLLPIFVLIGTQRGCVNSLMPMFYKHAWFSLSLSVFALAMFLSGRTDLAGAATKAAQMLLYAAYFVLLSGLGSRLYRRPFILALAVVTLCHLMLENRLHFIVGLSVFLLYLVWGNENHRSKLLIRTIVAFFVFLTFVAIAFNASSLVLPETWQTDSRSFLIEELKNDFSMKDMALGRGALGGYFSDYFYSLSAAGIEGGDAAFRQVSESGYLHIVIKSGVLGVVVILLLKVRAIFMARFLPAYRLSFGSILFFMMHALAMIIGYNLAFDPYHVFMYLVTGWVISEAKRKRKLERQ